MTEACGMCSGGYRSAEQQRRERLQLRAAGRFACGDTMNEIAHDLAGHAMVGAAVNIGAWREDDTEALSSKSPVSRKRRAIKTWAYRDLLIVTTGTCPHPLVQLSYSIGVRNLLVPYRPHPTN
jgi:hypothetical protein